MTKLSLKTWFFASVGIVCIVSFLVFSMNILRQAKLASKQKIVPNINKIQVVGNLKNIDSQIIKTKLQRLLQSDFIDLDLSTIRTTVKSMSWVRNVSVSRIFPGILKIKIDEQEPVAIWNKTSYLNPWGEIFSVTNYQPERKLVKLVGKNEQAKPILKLYENIKNIIGEEQLQTIFQNPKGIYRLYLSDGLEVVLGRKQLKTRVNRLVMVLDLLDEFPKTIAKIDLRYQKGLAIKFTKRVKHV